MENDAKSTLALLSTGQAPDDIKLLRRMSAGMDTLTDFIKEKYFLEYIAPGGGKIKFVTGKSGSGKTHFLRLLLADAREQGFNTVFFSAKDIWLHDFKEIYTEIFKALNLMNILEACARKIIEDLGYEYDALPNGMSFADYLSSIGELDALTKREIRNQLQTMFLKDPILDNNFAIACSLLTGAIIGHPVLEQSSKELLLLWLSGSSDIKLAAIRNLGLSPAKITKYNARHMLRSLAKICSTAASPGIIVAIDDVDILVNSTSLDTIRYTRLKREDAYESIRELIDEIDTLKNIMFFFAFDSLLIDDELHGILSYQALWLRVQNEIVSNRFNYFTDMINLDAYAAEVFDMDTLLRLSDNVANIANELGCSAEALDAPTIQVLLSRAQFTKTSIPRQIVLATCSGALPLEVNL